MTQTNNQASMTNRIKDAIFTPKFSLRNTILSLVLGFVVAFITLAIIYGWNDAQFIVKSLFQSGFLFKESIPKLVDKIVILGFAGLAIGFGMKCGLLNIGVSGQMTLGAFAGYYACREINLKLIAEKHAPMNIGSNLIVGLIVVVLVSGLLAFITSLLKAHFKVNEVIATIMTNWIVVYLLKYFASQSKLAKDGNPLFNGNATQDGINQGVKYNGNTAGTTITGTLDNAWMLAGIGVALFITIAVVLWLVVFKTRMGFKMIAVGKNIHAADYAGFSIKKQQIMAFTISGLLAGFAGFAFFFLSVSVIPAKSTPINEGFLGIAVALVALSNPVATIGSAVVFGLLTGPVDGVILPGLPASIVGIFAGIETYFVAITILITRIRPINWIRTIRANREPKLTEVKNG